MNDTAVSEESVSQDRLSALRFDSTALSPEQAFARWRGELAMVFDTSVGDYDSERYFQGQIETYHLGGLLLNRTASGPQRFVRNHRTVAQSGVDHFLIQAHRHGGFRGAIDDDEFQIGPGDVCVFDLSRPCATQSTHFDNVTLCVPRATLAPLVGDPDALHGLVLSSQTAGGILLSEHLLSLFRAAGRLPMREAMAISGGSTAFVAGCLRDIADGRDAGRPQMRAALAIQVRRFIDNHLSDAELGPDIIMAALGVSRATLFRMFEPAGGVAAYIRKRRLAGTLNDLRVPRRCERILDIALKWGFRSEAAFSRSFRAMYGFSPSEFRGGADGIVVNGLSNSESPSLGHWVRGLTLS